MLVITGHGHGHRATYFKLQIELFLCVLIEETPGSRSFRRRSQMIIQLLFQCSDPLLVVQKLVPQAELCVTDGQKWPLELWLRADSRSKWWSREAGGCDIYGIDPLLQVPDIADAKHLICSQ
jgi:hypothetical protein